MYVRPCRQEDMRQCKGLSVLHNEPGQQGSWWGGGGGAGNARERMLRWDASEGAEQRDRILGFIFFFFFF